LTSQKTRVLTAVLWSLTAVMFYTVYILTCCVESFAEFSHCSRCH